MELGTTEKTTMMAKEFKEREESVHYVKDLECAWENEKDFRKDIEWINESKDECSCACFWSEVR